MYEDNDECVASGTEQSLFNPVGKRREDLYACMKGIAAYVNSQFRKETKCCEFVIYDFVCIHNINNNKIINKTHKIFSNMSDCYIETYQIGKWGT